MANTFVSINKLHPVLQEIAKQTDIDRFMEPYDAAKVKRAAELNALVYKTDIHKPLHVLKLIESTISDLDCEYSADFVYKYLLSIYNPKNNTNDFDWYNNICQQLYNSKDNIEEMTFVLKNEIAKKEAQKIIKVQKEEQEKQESQKVAFYFIIITIGIAISIIWLVELFY